MDLFDIKFDLKTIKKIIRNISTRLYFSELVTIIINNKRINRCSFILNKDEIIFYNINGTQSPKLMNKNLNPKQQGALEISLSSCIKNDLSLFEEIINNYKQINCIADDTKIHMSIPGFINFTTRSGKAEGKYSYLCNFIYFGKNEKDYDIQISFL